MGCGSTSGPSILQSLRISGRSTPTLPSPSKGEGSRSYARLERLEPPRIGRLEAIQADRHERQARGIDLVLVRDGSEPGLFRQAHEGVEVDRILVGVAMVGVEGRRVRAAAVAPGDLRWHVVGLDDDNAVLLGVRDPAPQVLHEVLFEQRIRDRPAFLVRVGPGGHRPARIKREFGRLLAGLGVAAVVIDEGADVQAVLDREPRFPQRRGKTVRIGDVAE